MDDNSPDESIGLIEEVLKGYPQREISVKVIHHERNRGVSAARNTAVANSTGDFLMFVDGDDYLELDAVETLVALQKNSDADIVNGVSFMEYDGVRETIPIREYQGGRQMALDMIEIAFRHALWGKLMRRSIFIEHGIKALEGANVSEDMLMITLFAYYSHKVVNCYKPVYHYDCGNMDSCLHTENNIVKSCKNKEQDLASYLTVRDYFKNQDNELYHAAEKAAGHFALALLNNYIGMGRKQDVERIKALYGDIVRDQKSPHFKGKIYKKLGYRYWPCRAVYWLYRTVEGDE